MIEPVYRYRYADELTSGGVTIKVMMAIEVRKTPKGAWCRRVWEIWRWGASSPVLEEVGKEFFVLDGAGKRRYHQEKGQAWESYKARKKAAKRHAQHRMRMAEAAEILIERQDGPPEKSALYVPSWLDEYDFSEC